MIRKFNAKDTTKIMQIWLETNVQAHDFIAKNYWYDNYQAVCDALSTAEIFVFIENNEIKGFVGIIENYIAGLFVLKEFQGQCIGKKLLDKCKEIYPRLTLKVYRKNLPAVTFYLNNDFVVAEKLLDENVQGEELAMVWSLKLKA